MTKLFQNDQSGIMINVELSKNLLEIRLLEWMREKHSDVFYNDLEMHEGGKVTVMCLKGTDGNEYTELQFSGDNGIMIFEECLVEAI
tara:strand:- start:394 stop:654 length:261 start_codon:yes stop_codon:yes gene_type:complete